MPDPREQFERTTCACGVCTAACLTMPGCLIPGDFQRIAKHLGVEASDDWLKGHFLASRGALIVVQGQITNVPTMVPAQRDDQSCIFLRGMQCSIHPVSPFGCAYHDCHMSQEEGEARSRACIEFQIEDACDGGEHTLAIKMLAEADRIAPATEIRRAAYEQLVRLLEQATG